MRITSPAEGYTGFGPAGIEFTNGVAEVDEVNDGTLAYFQANGYGIDGDEPTQPEPAPVVDSRDIAPEVKVGTPLRDAAVDPQPGDFLSPVNAGQEDPHGPKVVAPGVHALPPGPIVPGEVHVDDTARQAELETAVAGATLVDGRDVGEVTQLAAEANGAITTPEAEGSDEAPKRPAKSATKGEWVAYATSVDTELTPEAAEAINKDDLIARYGQD